ncbi:response regulator transcription factor [Nostoc sp.]|uniref:response regulator transcription factor n=1 Tax=Nostoc sp. TaxID=1180 RepID=UPI002FFB78F7
MRILLIEDDQRIAEPLTEHLRHQYHVVDLAPDGITGFEQALIVPYDLILLDLMLPRLDGITLCKHLRAERCQALILMLTAKDTTADKVIGLDAGADDYLVKPFKLAELAARIRALSRRSLDIKPTILTHGNLQLDPSTCEVNYGHNRLPLTPKEYTILEVFLRSPTRVFTRSELLEKLWEFDEVPGEETIKTHLTNLRRKIKAAGCESDLIRSVYGIGYRLQVAD